MSKIIGCVDHVLRLAPPMLRLKWQSGSRDCCGVPRCWTPEPEATEPHTPVATQYGPSSATRCSHFSKHLFHLNPSNTGAHSNETISTISRNALGQLPPFGRHDRRHMILGHTRLETTLDSHQLSSGQPPPSDTYSRIDSIVKPMPVSYTGKEVPHRSVF